MLPTVRSILLFAAGMPVVLALILYDPGLWWLGWVYAICWVGLCLLDAASAVRWPDLDASFEIPAISFIGEVGAIDIALTARRGRSPLAVRFLCDVSGDAHPLSVREVLLEAGRRMQFQLPVRPTRRGEVRLERLWFRWTGPLGLVARIHTEQLDRTLAVVPNIRSVQRTAVRFFARDALFGQKPQSQQGDGSEFSALREYVPGLDHRSIDWKQSAKHRVLTCKEFETERNHQIILAFDTGHLMSEPVDGVPKLDHAINAGLLLGYICTRMGDRVGLFGFDAQVKAYNSPVAGSRGFQLLQRRSAELAYSEDETNFTLGLAELTSRLNRRSLIIVMTDFVDTTTAEIMLESLGRLARRHLVMFVALKDPALHAPAGQAPENADDMARSVIAAGIAQDRQIVLERLHRLGVLCIDSRAEDVSVKLVNEYLSVKQRDQL